MLRTLSLLAFMLLAFALAGCSSGPCGEGTMTFKSPIAFGTQTQGVPIQTYRVPMTVPQAYVAAPQSACSPAAASVTPRYVPIP